MKVLVIGASENPDRYAFKAIQRLRENHHDVVAIGSRPGTVNGVSFETTKKQFADIETVTLYINPHIQESYYDYIIGLKPKRVIFNPGTENLLFEKMLAENKIETIEACTLVMLATHQF